MLFLKVKSDDTCAFVCVCVCLYICEITNTAHLQSIDITIRVSRNEFGPILSSGETIQFPKSNYLSGTQSSRGVVLHHWTGKHRNYGYFRRVLISFLEKEKCQ